MNDDNLCHVITAIPGMPAIVTPKVINKGIDITQGSKNACHNSECRFYQKTATCPASNCSERVRNKCRHMDKEGECLKMAIDCVSFVCGGCDQSTNCYVPEDTEEDF